MFGRLGLNFGRLGLARGEGVGGRYSRTVIFGDSITNQNTSTGQFNAHGYWTVANSILGWPMTLLNNAGVSSNGTDQMLARISTDVLAYTPDIVIGLGGTNDHSRGISAGAVGVAGSTIDNLAQIFTALRAGGVKRIVWGTITPRSDQAGSLLTFIQTVNAWLRTTPLIDACPDYYAAWADTGNSDLPYTNFTYDSAPRLHPSVRGATAMGVALAAKLTPFVTTAAALNSNDQDYLEYASNPAGIGDNASGTNGWTLVTGVTGNGPNGWASRRRNTGTGVASKTAGAVPQLVASFAADNDGTAYIFGSDDVLALGRYDQGWVATTAYTYGWRRRPTTPNGYTYKCVVPGTTGGAEPTWPTTEGTLVVDGTVTWLCQRMPQTGDVFRASVDLVFSGQVSGKWAVPVLNLAAIDTTASGIGLAVSSFYDVTGGMGVGADSLPHVRLVSPDMTIGVGTIRHLRASIFAYGQAAGGVTMQVLRASIRRISP